MKTETFDKNTIYAETAKQICSGCPTGWCKTREVECVAEIPEDAEEGIILALVEEYQEFLNDKASLLNEDHFEKGVDILIKAEKLGFKLEWFPGLVDNCLFIPGFVYAVRSRNASHSSH
jgi:hypothetical protein